MKCYFGGAERPNAIEILRQAGGRRVMLSFAEPPTDTCWDLYRRYCFEVLADSGAYSIWKRGCQININDYMDWIEKHNIEKYFNLDVVGDWKRTQENQRYMETRGFRPIPVYHHGEPAEVLDGLVSRYEYIGLGGTVGLSYTHKQSFFSWIFNRYPKHKFHGLGIANLRLLKQYPFHSTDSVWWLWKWRDSQRLATGSVKDEKKARVQKLLSLETIETKYQLQMGVEI